MPDFQLPLSGDVNQMINPWTWSARLFGSQVGLINVNLGKSSDPVLEQRIIDDVGTYGRQIGQLGDALRVLIDHVELGRLKPHEERALNALKFQLDEIDRLKARRSEESRAEHVRRNGSAREIPATS
jgi:hypothetical protein